MKKYILSLLFIVLNLYANDKILNNNVSVTISSYAKHIYPSATNTSNEGFGNYYFDIRYKISKKSKILIGTIKNSQSNRCFVLGIEHQWYNFRNNTSFQGIYSYSGEFFHDIFSDCGNNGTYKYFRTRTGVGFVPYIYHGFELPITKNISLDLGFILPVISVTAIRFNF